jgi:hypothetical protein
MDSQWSLSLRGAAGLGCCASRSARFGLLAFTTLQTRLKIKGLCMNLLADLLAAQFAAVSALNRDQLLLGIKHQFTSRDANDLRFPKDANRIASGGNIFNRL